MNRSVSFPTGHARPSTTLPMPRAPRTLAGAGLSREFLVELLLKTVARHATELPSQMAAELCLPRAIVEELVEVAAAQQLVSPMGRRNAAVTAEMRYQLTARGRDRAAAALETCGWVGAAPVPLEQFVVQVAAQSVRQERLTEEALRRVFERLTLTEDVLHRIGPAVNSGQSILLHGPAGNGKSSIARAICDAFASHVFLPHALAIGGDVIVFFDPVLHTPVTLDLPAADTLLRRPPALDARYVPCLRPAVITGGELTLDRLELRRNSRTGLYDAPMQLKASGGIFVVDDFGRQRHEPQELINRLIVPLETGTEHLLLENGRKIELPFDTLVVFSTNFEPRSLMDEAGLRRLRHKILIDRPDRKTFVRILVRTAGAAGLVLDEDALAYILFDLYGRNPGTLPNAFHARFLVDQCVAICAYRAIPPRMSPEILDHAWQNLMAAH